MKTCESLRGRLSIAAAFLVCGTPLGLLGCADTMDGLNSSAATTEPEDEGTEGSAEDLPAAGFVNQGNWLITSSAGEDRSRLGPKGPPLTEAPARNIDPALVGLSGTLAADLVDQLDEDGGDALDLSAESNLSETDASESDESVARAAKPTIVSQEKLPDTLQPGVGEWEKCLRLAGSSELGFVLNRYLWCQNWTLNGYAQKTPTNGPPTIIYTWKIKFQLVSMGRKNGRSVRVFARAVPIGANDVMPVSWRNDFLYSFMQVYPDCVQSAQHCSVSADKPRQRVRDWMRGAWKRWDVSTTEYDTDGEEKVGYYSWTLVDVSTNTEFGIATGETKPVPIRCDSANYFTRAVFGTTISYPQACVFYNVFPNLIYSRSNGSVKGVADHIFEALTNPNGTTPRESHPKNIPGEVRLADYQGTHALHRVPDGSEEQKKNKKYKDYACQNKGPYTAGGMPVRPSTAYQCDEFPFQSTLEGAGNAVYDFSVKWVNGSQNASAGTALKNYYFNDRILYRTDNFWVKILP